MKLFPENIKLNPYVITCCTSLLLSWLAISTDNLINHDGVAFMDAAKAYIRHGASASFIVYDWPFYSWLVGVVHQLLWFQHVEQSAHFINSFMYAAICVLFVRIYAEVTLNRGSLWIAVIVILAFTGINKYRADIMRDFLYWLSYLAAFFSFLLYYKRHNWGYAVLWQLLLGIAFLARVEAVVIALFGPLALLFRDAPFRVRVVDVARMYSVYIIGAVLLILLFFTMDPSVQSAKFSRLPVLLNYINLDVLLDSYNKGIGKLAEIFWYEGAKLEKYRVGLGVVFLFTLFGYVLTKIITSISIPFFMVLIYGVFTKRIPWNEYNRVIVFFSSFLFVFFLVYMVRGPVLTPRYTASLAFLLLLLLSQVLEFLIPRVKAYRHGKKIIFLSSLYLFVSTVDSVITTQGSSKDYILEAGYWVKDNLDKSLPVYSNYYKAIYYTDRGYSFKNSMEMDDLIRAVRADKFSQDTCVIFHVKQKETDQYQGAINILAEEKKITYLKEFTNKKGSKLVIFQVAKR